MLPDLHHVAVFDTAFHASLPNRAKRYALPLELADKHGIRRYGFHGLSYEFIVDDLRRRHGPAALDERLIVAHLGNGASMAAIRTSGLASWSIPTRAGVAAGSPSWPMAAAAASVIVAKQFIKPADKSEPELVNA